MKKITELTEERFRTRHVKDMFGNRQKTTEQITVRRPVKTVVPLRRIGHAVIDSLCLNVILAISFFLVLPLMVLDREAIDLIENVVSLSVFIGFYALFELSTQRTPGKYVTRTIVIDEYGNKPSGGAILLRTLIRIIPFEAFSCLGDHSHGWHDRWTNTFVVTLEELEILKKLQIEQS